MAEAAASKTANFVAGQCRDNRDYLEIWVQPKGETGEKYRISVGGASVLIAELVGALARQVQS